MAAALNLRTAARYAAVAAIVVGLGALVAVREFDGDGDGGPLLDDHRAEIGEPVPDFRLRDLDGREVRLSDFRGKTVVLNFWATWCPPCREEMPDLLAVHEQRRATDDLVVLAVDLQETAGPVGAFVEEFGLTFPVLIDSDGAVAQRYRVLGLPATFFIDRDGVLRGMNLGPVFGDLLPDGIAAADAAGAAGRGAPADGGAASTAGDASGIGGTLTEAEVAVADELERYFPATDFSRRTVSLTEITPVVARDAIPALFDPAFVDFASAAIWLRANEPVVALEIDGDARAYPLQILMWHEIAGDTVGGVPVVVTFCPLCNTAITFDRRVDGETRTFGVSGALRRSDLIMYDHETETLWQQITGEAIVGRDAGSRLRFLPSQIVSFAEFQATFPGGKVLSRDTGHVRRYGQNPYPGYDTVGSSPLFRVAEFDDGRLEAKERVLTVAINGDAVAFPFTGLSQRLVIDAEVDGRAVVAFWQPGTVSALDATSIVDGADVGSAAAYSPLLDGERLRFEARDGAIVDAGTGSVWNVLGRAVSGPLAGAALEPVLSANHFWFAWSVFQPDTRVIPERGAG